MRARHALERSRRARHARRLRSHAVLRGVGVVLTAVLAFTIGGAATAYRNLQSNIATGDADALIPVRPDRPTPNPEDPNAGQELNFLLIGSDARDGENAQIGGYFGGMRSDTTILMHVSADRERIEMVSIPRDSMLTIPECQMTNGTRTAATFDQFNAAFAIGADYGGDVTSAAACSMATVEAATGVYLDGFFVVDFTGFISMVDALGGVPMCVPNDMRSPKALLDVQAGQQVFDGQTALAYARARTGAGLSGHGSDLGRIGRQQELLAATVNEVFSKNLLTQQVDLYRFLDAATSSLAADDDFSAIPTLAGLAFSLRNVSGGNITFMTVPVEPYPADTNRLQWAPGAAEIWERIALDLPVVEPEPEPEPSEPTDPTDSAEPSPAPRPGEDPFTPDDLPAVCA